VVGRNERCPCGSGKKYKRCCGDDGPQTTLDEEQLGIKEKTPAEITPALLSFASNISTGALSLITIKPRRSSRPLFCYENVEAAVTEQGGELVVGWKIWECRHWIKAVHHAAWRSPDGHLIDISPEKGERLTLFLVDDRPRPRPVPPVIVATNPAFVPAVEALIAADSIQGIIQDKAADGIAATDSERAQLQAATVHFGKLLRQALRI
jgi:hypothetical protein